MKHFVKSFGIQLTAFISVIATLGVVYAAWNDTVSTGDPLSSASWNEVINRIEVFNVDSGKIGIGTNAPDNFLHLVSDTQQVGILQENTDGTQGGLYPSITQYSYGAGHGALVGGRSEGTKASPLAVSAGVTLQTMVGRGHDGTDFQEVGRISVKSGDSFSNSNIDGKIEFQVRDNNAANTAMVIQETGNVGIGTTTPGDKLHVDGNIQVGDTADIIYTNNLNTMSSSADMAVNYSAANLIFNSDYGENMRIDRDGNVGIGTSSPDSMLTVESDNLPRPVLHLKNTSGNNRNAFISFTGESGGETSTYNIFQWSAGQVLHFDVNDNGTQKDLFRLRKVDQSAQFYGLISTSGNIRIAENNTTCIATNHGEIRFDGNNFYGCTPSGWSQLNN